MKRLILRRVFKAPEPPAPPRLKTPVARNQFVGVGARHFRTYAALAIGDRFSPQLEGWENAVFVYSGRGFSYRADDGTRQEARFAIDTVCLLLPALPITTPFQNLRVGTIFRYEDETEDTTFEKLSSTRAGLHLVADNMTVTHHVEPDRRCTIVREPEVAVFARFYDVPMGSRFRIETDGPIWTRTAEREAQKDMPSAPSGTLTMQFWPDHRCQLIRDL